MDILAAGERVAHSHRTLPFKRLNSFVMPRSHASLILRRRGSGMDERKCDYDGVN